MRKAAWARMALAGVALLALSAALNAGTITGRVLDSTGKPVAGARIQWLAYRTDDEIVLDQTTGNDPAPLGEAATDEQGRFRIVLDKPGLSVAVRVLPAGLPSARFTGPFESSEDNDLFDIQLPAAESASGQVVDDSGKPVAGARVFVASTAGPLDGDTRILAEARTGADGSFSIPDAPDGARALVVRASGFVPVTRIQTETKATEKIQLQKGGVIHGTIVDAAGKPAPGLVVTADQVAALSDPQGNYRLPGVSPGAHHVQALGKDDFAARKDGVRVRKGEETAAALTLKRGVAISGTVIEEGTRRPVVGARISAYPPTGFGGFARRRAERSVKADQKGRFRLSGLAPSRYSVEAVREGYLTSSIPGVNAGGATPTANIALRRAATLAGRVTDEKGQGVVGARVRITRELGLRRMLRGAVNNPASILGDRGVLTAPDGSFRLRGLEPEKNLSLEAAKSGYATARRPGLTIKAGDAIKDLTLVVRQGIQAKGKVVDPTGQPVAGAEIRAVHKEDGMMGGARVQMRLMGLNADRPDTSTGNDGSFTLKGLEEGEYTLAVSRDGYARKTVPGLQVKADKDNVWPPVTLAAGAVIGGAVRDTSGAPVLGAQVFAIDIGSGGRPQTGTSDADGRFRLDGFAAEKSILLNIQAQGYATQQKNVTPPTSDLVVVLKTAGTIRGRVEDADAKKPVTDFAVGRSGPRGGGGGGFQIAMGGRGGDQNFQSDDGTFELSDVPAGKWTIRATAAGYRAGEISGVEIGEGETKEGVVLSLKRGGGLSGRIADLRGTAVANSSVTWHPSESQGGAMGAMVARIAGGGAGGSTTSDADGRYQFDGLPEGRVTITANHPDYLEASRDVDPSKETAVDLVLGTGASISGTVIGTDGRSGVGGALVQLNEEGDSGGFGGSNESSRTDGAGNFLFDHLAAGRYKLTATGNTGKSTAKDVVVADNQQQSGVMVQMANGALVHGNVTGLPAGQLGGVRINASANGYNDSTQTNDSGAYSLSDVPAGVVRLSATTNFLSGRTTAKTVEVPDGGDFPADIVFEGTSRLSGRVTRGDRPLPGLFVVAVPDPPRANTGRASGQTDDNGSYTLDGLEDGNYQVSVSGQGVGYRKAMTVSGDTNGDIALPAISVTGMITETGSGVALEGVTVQAQTGKETQAFAMKQGVTDSSGRYFIDDVDPGAYQLSARKSGYQLKTQAINVASDNVTSDFALDRGTGIGIQANDGLTGLPLRGINVLAYGAGGSVAFSGSVSLDSTGRGEVSSLGPGVYAIYFFSNGYSPRSYPSVQVPSPTLTVALTPGGTVEVRPAVQVSGRIVDASGGIYLLSPFRLDGSVHPSPPVTVWQNFAPGSYQLILDAGTAYPFTVIEGRTTLLEVK
ncbi:MAG TPA: carboxypeptidase regulatory-like domain-containing protein [Thermoanaerobaculia bacterium]|nr:carboxypeptidase regulatory-like domain-containing protein [Thermoanaerobaculia bacterium]